MPSPATPSSSSAAPTPRRWRSPSPGTATAPIVIEAAPGETVTVQGGSRGFEVSSRSWVTIRGFHVADTTDEGIRVSSSSNITIEGNEVSGAGAPALPGHRQGHRRSRPRRTRPWSTTTSTTTAMPASTWAATPPATSSRPTPRSANAREYTRAAPGFFIRRADNNTVAANVSFDNEDAGINIWDGHRQPGGQQPRLPQRRPRDRQPEVRRHADIVSNTVYDSVDSGIEVVSSTDVTLANNISVDNGNSKARTQGNIRVDTTSASTTTVDYDLVYLSTPGVMIDLGGHQVHLARGLHRRHRQGAARARGRPEVQERRHRTVPAEGRVARHRLRRLGRARPAGVDALGKARKDDPETTNTGAGPRTFDDRGAFEFQPK